MNNERTRSKIGEVLGWMEVESRKKLIQRGTFNSLALKRSRVERSDL
jgi:hypothetical protein